MTVFGTAVFLNAQGQPGGRAVAPQSGTNVAVIDVGFIFKNATRFKQSMNDLKRDDEAFKKEVQNRTDALTAQVKKLDGTQRGSAEYKFLEEQIAADQTKLRLDIARKQKARIEKEAKIYFNAYRDIEFHVERFASRYGIDLVLRFNSEPMDPSKPESVLTGINRLVVFEKDLNITGSILGEMNRGTPEAPQRIGGTRPFVPPGGGGTRKQ